MSSVKYSNGMYKTTSKSQENTVQMLFTGNKSMGYNLDQTSGFLTIDIQDYQNNFKRYVLNRRGHVIAREW